MWEDEDLSTFPTISQQRYIKIYQAKTETKYIYLCLIVRTVFHFFVTHCLIFEDFSSKSFASWYRRRCCKVGTERNSTIKLFRSDLFWDRPDVKIRWPTSLNRHTLITPHDFVLSLCSTNTWFYTNKTLCMKIEGHSAITTRETRICGNLT